MVDGGGGDGRGGGGGTTCTGFHLPVSKSPTPRTCNSSFPALESANIKLKANKANIKVKANKNLTFVFRFPNFFSAFFAWVIQNLGEISRVGGHWFL